MAIVWKPLQKGLAPQQTAVLCEKMGEKYKWVALSSLSVIGISWILLGLSDHEFFRSGSLGIKGVTYLQGAIGAVCWVGLVVVVMLMGVKLHPNSHKRASLKDAELSLEEMKLRRRKSIKKMDLLLKAELSIALIAVFTLAWSQAISK